MAENQFLVEFFVLLKMLVKTIFGQKHFGQKKFLVKRNFGQK